MRTPYNKTYTPDCCYIRFHEVSPTGSQMAKTESFDWAPTSSHVVSMMRPCFIPDLLTASNSSAHIGRAGKLAALSSKHVRLTLQLSTRHLGWSKISVFLDSLSPELCCCHSIDFRSHTTTRMSNGRLIAQLLAPIRRLTSSANASRSSTYLVRHSHRGVFFSLHSVYTLSTYWELHSMQRDISSFH